MDDVDVQSSSDEATVAAPLTCSQLAKKGYTEPSSEEDEPIIGGSRRRIRIQLEGPIEKSGASNAKAVTKEYKPPAARPKQYHEVFIAGGSPDHR
jgi:hypothetical protein